MLYLAFAGQAAVWAGLYFLLDRLARRWEGKAFFTLMQTNALWKGVVACFVLIFPLLLLGFFVGWTHIRIDNWLWIAFYSGALLVLSCRRWWVRPVSYTHLDVYKRQWYIFAQFQDNAER